MSPCRAARNPLRQEHDLEISDRQDGWQTPISLRLRVAAESAPCRWKRMCSAGRSPQARSAGRTTRLEIAAKGSRASSLAGPLRKRFFITRLECSFSLSLENSRERWLKA